MHAATTTVTVSRGRYQELAAIAPRISRTASNWPLLRKTEAFGVARRRWRVRTSLSAGETIWSTSRPCADSSRGDREYRTDCPNVGLRYSRKHSLITDGPSNRV